MRYEEFKFEDIEVGDELQWKASGTSLFTYGKCYKVTPTTGATDREVVVDVDGLLSTVSGNDKYWNLIKLNNPSKVQSLPPFKSMKFRVENEYHSKQIQEYLFSIGYKWKSAEPFSVFITKMVYIHAHSDGTFSYSSLEDYYPYYKEYKLTSHTTYYIEPVIPKIDVVNILGKQYNKADVEELLKTLEEVK